MKSAFFLVVTNLAVMLVLGVVCSIFGIDQYTGGLGNLLIFSAIFGMGGSFISLAMSKWMAKRSTGAHVIEQPRNEAEAWLLNTVKRQAEKAGIGMPEVAIYESPDMNAFATGMSRNNALVAVSTGLLRNMERREVEAVLGHEVSHVANGDMVTLTLIQGVMNTFVIFLSRVLGGIIDGMLRGNRESSGPGFAYHIIVFVLQMVLGVLASIVVMWFSRYREFRADTGGAQLTDKNAMIGALRRLGGNRESQLPQEVSAFGISGGVGAGIKKLFMTHPPIEERIAALQRG